MNRGLSPSETWLALVVGGLALSWGAARFLDLADRVRERLARAEWFRGKRDGQVVSINQNRPQSAA